MKQNKSYNNEYTMVIKTCEGYKALKIYFDDYHKSYKIDRIDEQNYDYYEDEYTEY